MPAKKYSQLAAAIILIQVAGWILVPFFTLPGPPIDVLEGTVWGQSFERGYHKGAPLFAWLLGIGARVLPGSLLPPLVFSQVAIATVYWASWRLANQIAGPREALTTLMVTTTVFYFGYPSPEFNPIILQLAFSALAGSFAYSALTQNRLRYWIIFGTVTGVGILSRYSIALHLLPLGIFILIRAEARQRLFQPGLWLAVVIAVVISAPHLHWMWQTDGISLRYVDQRAGVSTGLNRVANPVRFAAAQLAALAPALLVFAIALFPLRREPSTTRSTPFDRYFLLALGIGPFLIVMIMSLVLGRKPQGMWGATLWVFTPLLAVVYVHDMCLRFHWRRFTAAWCLAFATPLMIFAASMVLGPTIMGRNKRIHFPSEQLAIDVTERYRAITGRKLRYVVGEMLLAGSVGYYSSDRPLVFQNAIQAQAPWIDIEDIRRCGAVLLWHATIDEEGLRQSFGDGFGRIEAQPVIVVKPPRFAIPEERFSVSSAILHPAPAAMAKEC